MIVLSEKSLLEAATFLPERILLPSWRGFSEYDLVPNSNITFGKKNIMLSLSKQILKNEIFGKGIKFFES